MGDNGKSFKFEKLKGRANYDEWKVAAKSYLVLKKLWPVVSTAHDESPETNETAISEITLMIDPSLYNYIIDSNSAKAVWDGLSKAFDDSGVARKVTILNQLVSIKLHRCENMETYVNEILLYWHKTKVAGFNIEEQVIASLMLGGLPEEYRAMVLGIENSAKDLTVDYVKTVLLQGIPELVSRDRSTERAMQIRGVDGQRGREDGQAFAVKRFFPKKKAGASSKPVQHKKKKSCFKCGSYFHLQATCPKGTKITCYGCGDIGHILKSCPKPKRKGKALIVMFSTAGEEDLKDNWYVDSGASVHMTNNIHLLDNLKKVQNREIIVANSARLTVRGVGDIKIKINTPTGEKSLIIRDVNYVPEMCANLISVHQLVRDGYRVIFNEKGCSIFDQKGILVCGNLTDGMYKLKYFERANVAAEVKTTEEKI